MACTARKAMPRPFGATKLGKGRAAVVMAADHVAGGEQPRQRLPRG